MTLLLPTHLKRLHANGLQQAPVRGTPAAIDFRPVVKLFTPAACTWLLTEIMSEDPDLAFGLCDLGRGCPALGSVNLRDLATRRGWLNLPIERERAFRAVYPLSIYVRAAQMAGRITDDRQRLDQAAALLAEEGRAS